MIVVKEHIGELLARVAHELCGVADAYIKGKGKKSKVNQTLSETMNGPDFSVREAAIPSRVVGFLDQFLGGMTQITASNQRFNHFVP